MRNVILIAALALLTGCCAQATSPMVVGKEYQLRLAGSGNVAQVRVEAAAGGWVRVHYLKNSALPGTGAEDEWLNLSQIVGLIPYP